MDKKEFSLIKRAKSFTHAYRGLVLFLSTEHNAWMHVVGFTTALFLGIHYTITPTEWCELLIVSGLVFMAEAFNTAIEIDINLTSPEYHPHARDTKDVAAGAVLIATFFAVLVGIVIFVPYIFR